MSIASNRARIASVAVSCVLVVSCATPTSTSDTRPQWQRQAAPPEFVTADDERPPMILSGTYFAAAQLFESQGDYVKAAQQYRKAVAVDHSFAEGFHRLGLIHSLLGERDRAIEALARAVELRPDDASLRNNLGFEYILSERWEDASNELDQATRLKSGFVRAHINLGIAQSRLQRFDQALANFRMVLPEPDAQYNLGLMYRGQQRYHEALVAFERVLELDPEFTVAWEQLQQIEAKLSRKAAAEPQPEPATSDAPLATADAIDEADPQATDSPVARTPTTEPAEPVEAATTEEADVPTMETVEAAIPEELAGEADLATLDLDFLMELVDRHIKFMDEIALPAFEIPDSQEDVEVAMSADASNEDETDVVLMSYGEDMPDYVASSETVELCLLSEEEFQQASRPVVDPWTLVCISEFEVPTPAIASAPDWTEETQQDGFAGLHVESECDDFLLIDLVDDMGPWFRVPTPKTSASKDPRPVPSSDWYNSHRSMCAADVETNGEIAGSADPLWCEPKPATPQELAAIASIDAFAALRVFEMELAEVREEIRCLESFDEEPSHVKFARVQTNRPTSLGNAPVEIPEPLHWMLEAIASAKTPTPLIVVPQDEEMGPPAPPATIVSSNPRVTVGTQSAKLTASKVDQGPQGKHNNQEHKSIQYEIHDMPVNKTNDRTNRPHDGKPLSDANDMEDIDGLLAIVFNELECLDNVTANGPARLYGQPFDSSRSITWPQLDINDNLMLPGDVLPLETGPFRMRSRRPTPSIPGLAPSNQPSGKYGHETTQGGQ